MKVSYWKILAIALIVFVMGQAASCSNCIDLLVLINNPTNGATVSDMVQLKASVTGSLASSVNYVKFTITGGPYAPSVLTAYSPSYTADWDTTAFVNGNYSIKAKAYASGGKTAESPAINVTVDNDIKWTFMVFINGDNNLDPAALDDLNEMKSAGYSNKINVVAQLDRDYSPGYWRYHLNSGGNWDITSFEQELDFGNPNVLRDFINWAMTSYPASRYVLVIWDHGAGWRERRGEAIKGISYDDHGGYIDSVELADVINSISRPIHIVGMDACLMAMVEVAYQIWGNSYFMVTSQQTEPGDGWPYDTILGDLKTNPNMSFNELVTAIVVRYMASYVGGGVTQSAFNLAYTGTVVNRCDTLAQALRSYITSGGADAKRTITDIIGATQCYSYTDYKDLYDFARRIKDGINNTTVDNAAQAVMDSIPSLIIREGHSGTDLTNSHGVSVWLPNTTQFGSGIASYRLLNFALNTQWDEFLDDLY